jgi:hypothetical protein
MIQAQYRSQGGTLRAHLTIRTLVCPNRSLFECGCNSDGREGLCDISRFAKAKLQTAGETALRLSMGQVDCLACRLK